MAVGSRSVIKVVLPFTLLFSLLIFLLWIFGFPFDYDEAEHAHAIWLVSQGFTPFIDFFECHTPYFWYLLAPLSTLMPESAGALFGYRFLALIGNFLFLILLFRHIRKSIPHFPTTLSILTIAVVVIHPLMIKFLVQFRMDGWGYAILFGALYMVRDKPRKLFWPHFWFGFLSALSVYLTPKFALLPVLWCLSYIPKRKKDCDGFGTLVLSIVMGVGASSLLMLGGLALVGINLRQAYDFVITYHVFFNQISSEKAGLLFSLMKFHILFILVCGGIGSWGWLLFKKKIEFRRFDVVMGLFLLFQVLMANVGYPQYSVPWFLVALLFIHYLWVFIRDTKSKWEVSIPIFLMIFFGWAAFQSWKINEKRPILTQQIHFINTLIERVSTEDYVVAFMPYHPIYRKDSFYGWPHSFGQGGVGTEPIMQRFQEHRYRFQKDFYKGELQEKPPQVIVAYKGSPVLYYPGQIEVLLSYINERKGAYEKEPCPPFDCFFLKETNISVKPM